MVKIIKDRDGRILNAALEQAKTDGFQWITRDAVAEAAGVSPATVNTAYGTMRGLKRAVLQAAVDRNVLEVVAQGLAERHEIVMNAPEDVRRRAAAAMVAS